MDQERGFNIVLVIVDQMRSDAIGKATPNLNGLMQTGLSFSNCYCASPLCSPSRNSLITGLFPGQHGVCGNMGDPIPEALRHDTYAKHLQASGYSTAYVGKHHYVDRYGLSVDLVDDDELISDYGYDFVWQVGDVAEERHNEDRFTKELSRLGMLDEWRHNVSASYVSEQSPELTTDGHIGDRACAHLQELCSRERPFLLTVGFVGPHGPHWSPKPWCDMFSADDVSTPFNTSARVGIGPSLYDSADLAAPQAPDDPETIAEFRRQRASALGQVAFIDKMVGDLVAVLHESSRFEDTLVVFISDHGNMMGDHGLAGKRFFYDSSARVPLILSGAGIQTDLRADFHVRKELVSGVDLYPTILSAARIADSRGRTKREGIDLLGLLSGRKRTRDVVYSELGTSIMVRNARWKLVFDPQQGGTIALFNMVSDASESENLAGNPDYADITAHLTERMLSRAILQTHYTHSKEHMNLQSVRV